MAQLPINRNESIDTRNQIDAQESGMMINKATSKKPFENSTTAIENLFLTLNEEMVRKLLCVCSLASYDGCD